MPSIGIILPPKWLSFNNFAPILKPTNTQTLEHHNKLIFPLSQTHNVFRLGTVSEKII